MIALKKVVIAILAFIISIQMLFIGGKLTNAYEFIFKYGAYFFIVAMVVGLIIFLCICFQTDDDQILPPAPVPYSSSAILNSRNSRNSRNTLSNRSRSPSRISNVIHTNPNLNPPRQFKNGHYLITPAQYQSTTKIQTKDALQKLLMSRQYSQYNLNRNTRLSHASNRYKSDNEILLDAKSQMLQQDLTLNQDQIFEQNDD